MSYEQAKAAPDLLSVAEYADALSHIAHYEKLRAGRVTFGREYRDSFGGRRVPIWIDAINGRRYAGTYFKSSGDYARVKLLKEKLTKRGVAFCDHTTPRAVAFCPYCRAKK